MDKIRTLIVDDEPIARRGLRQQLESETDIEIIGECANGREAIAAINTQAPDLVFLDVQMPLVNGFGVVEALGDNLPVVVFVTAFDEHAIRAFEVNALDYILKPIDPERFRRTLARVRTQLSGSNLKQLRNKLDALLDGLGAAEQREEFVERLVIKEGPRLLFVNVNDVVQIKAHGNYVQVHTASSRHLLRETMDGIERKLNPQHFIRLRRSTIVQVDQIKELQPLFNGEFTVVLNDGTQVTSSRRYRKNLDVLLKG